MKFVYFSEKNQYVFRVLQQENKIYKGTIRIEDVYNKQWKWKKLYEERKFKKWWKKRTFYRYPNGDVYEGSLRWIKRRNLKFANGNVYEGKFKYDNIEGKRIFIYENGNVYEGEFKDNKKEGKRILKFAYSDVYEGEF